MPVKLRLQRKGRSKAPFYHIVAADSRSPRDGRFIEKIGTYNPLTVPAGIELNVERAYYWLTVGAQPTDTVHAILGFKGVLYKKHLQLGVKKGALTQEQADAKLTEWIEKKEAEINKRREKSQESQRKFLVSVDGTAKAKTKAAPPLPVLESEETPAETAPEAVEASVETPEAPAAEPEAPAAEPEAPVAETEEAAPAAEPENTDEA